MMRESTILITGATGLIGRMLALHFAEQGSTVVALSRSSERLSELQHAAKGRVEGIVVDLSDPNAPSHVAEELTRRGLSPNSLVNNARSVENLVLPADGRPSRLQWQEEFLLDVVVPHELSLSLVDRQAAELEAIVNMSSIYGVVAHNPVLYENGSSGSPIHYGVAKAAVIQLTRELAVRLAPRAVRVNCVSFGGVAGRADAAFEQRYANLAPAGRMLTREDVVGAVDFLVSPASRGMTGHNLVVDGGWTSW